MGISTGKNESNDDRVQSITSTAPETIIATPDTLNWDTLIDRIETGECTPFLGSGASWPRIPRAKEIAADWSQRCNYPLLDKSDLAKVAQTLAVEIDPSLPRDLMFRICKKAHKDTAEPCKIHKALAFLPFGLYITTNYDNYMLNALENAHELDKTKTRKKPQTILCSWSRRPTGNRTRELPLRFSDTDPLIYHLHGRYLERESMVITEDDYLSFLTWMTFARHGLPDQIKGALASTSLLFIGYSLNDWNFRVLLRGIVAAGDRNTQKQSISVQITPDGMSPQVTQHVKNYLEKYWQRQLNLPLEVCWKSADAFADDLMEHWNARLKQYGKEPLPWSA